MLKCPFLRELLFHLPKQNQLHGMNGISITGRGRPASVDVDLFNTLQDMHNNTVCNPPTPTATNATTTTQILRRNMATGKF